MRDQFGLFGRTSSQTAFTFFFKQNGFASEGKGGRIN
jgi:hypothetical protein